MTTTASRQLPSAAAAAEEDDAEAGAGKAAPAAARRRGSLEVEIELPARHQAVDQRQRTSIQSQNKNSKFERSGLNIFPQKASEFG